MQQKSNIIYILRYFAISLLLCTCSTVFAQQNHIRKRIPVEAVSPATGASESNSMTTTQYYDVAGREVQTVLHGTTPQGKDLVSHIAYDSLGRRVRDWAALPLGTQGGSYVPLSAFESSGYSSAYHIDYSYETMPGGRLLSTTGANTPGKSVTYEYGYNSTGITRYTIDGTTITNNGSYLPGALSYTRTTDEDGNTILVFKDNDEKIILERRVTAYGQNTDTYHIYDIYGNLRCVLPPIASEATASTGDYNLSDCTQLEQYAYFYEYDHRNRRTSSKLPATGWHYTIYDADSRPVMTSTPEQYIRNEWSYTKYDALGRVVIEGTITNAAMPSTLSVMLNDICVKETFDISKPFGYTDNINLGTSPQILKVYYYDTYDFITQPQFNETADAAPSSFYPPKTMLTGTYTALLGNSEKYSVTAHWYDNRGRNIHTAEYENINNTGTSTHYSYDFNNRLLKEETRYTTATGTLDITYEYNYDTGGRETECEISIVNTSGTETKILNRSLHTTSYDEFCRKTTENILDSIYNKRHLYHNDGKYRGVESDSFTQYLHYGETANAYGAQYNNGRISAIETYQNGNTAGTRFDILYDHLARYTEAKAYSGNGYGYKHIKEVFGYDDMSNIKYICRTMPEGDVNVMDFTLNGNQRVKADDCDSQRYPLEYEYMYIQQSLASDTHAYDLNGNETRDLTRDMLYARYNHLNLPDSITFTGGNILQFYYLADGRRVGTKALVQQTALVSPTANNIYSGDPITLYTETRTGPLVFKNGIMSHIDIPGGYISLQNDTTQQPDVKPYFFVKDYLGNVRLTCDGNTGEVLQSLEYLPSGVPYNRVNPSMQPRRFCGKEEVELHGFDMYDSGARWQYSLIPRFSTIDPLAEKYYHLSPYAYCAGDPVNLVDPDGRKIRITGKLYQEALAGLEYISGLELELDKDNYLFIKNDIDNTGEYDNLESELLARIINDNNICVNIRTLNTQEIAQEYNNYVLGGAFNGNNYDKNNNIVYTLQTVDPKILNRISSVNSKPGADMLHEVSESYEGALIAREESRSIGNSKKDLAFYQKAHKRAYPQSGEIKLDLNGSNVLIYVKDKHIATIALKKYNYE